MVHSNLIEIRSTPLLPTFYRFFGRSCVGGKFNMEHCLSKLSDLELLTIDIGYFYGIQRLDENIISLLKKHHRLKKLALRGADNISCNITISNILDYFPNITSFSLFNINISNVAFTSSDKILNLAELKLQCTAIDDGGIQHITKRAKQLKVLNIKACRDMTDKALYCVLRNCPLLEELSLGYCTNFWNHGLLSIAQRPLNLKYLPLTVCKNIDDDGVISLVESCHGLTYITLGGCTKMTDNFLIAIGEHSPLLREAEFSYCFSISTRGIYYLIRSCRSLDKLILSFCRGISDDNIVDVNDNHLTEVKDQQIEMVDQQTETKDQQTETENQQTEMKNQQTETKGHQTQMKDAQLISKIAIHSHLKELKLRSCTDISKDTVLRFTGICPDLREINLSNCINNNEDVDFIFRVCDDCQFVKEFKMYHQIVHRKNYNRKS